MKKYIITYWTGSESTWTFEANDVQWKEYGIRAVNDETGEHYVFPYNSVQHVEIEDEE